MLNFSLHHIQEITSMGFQFLGFGLLSILREKKRGFGGWENDQNPQLKLRATEFL